MTSVIHGQGAITLRHIPVDRDGHARVVASATYAIEDLRYSDGAAERAIGSGSATVGAVNTALTAAAGPGATDTDVVTVASAAGISTGRPYMVVDVDGRTELISVRTVATLNVHTHFDLRQDFATTASLRSVEITASFPSDEADDDAEIGRGPHPYQVTWVYEIDSETYVVSEVLWLRRTTVTPMITELDVLRAYPTIGPRLRNRADIADAIAVAMDDYVAEVLASGRDPDGFRANETARVAVRARALEYAFRWCGPAPHDVAEADRFQAQFKYLMTQLLSGIPRPGVVTVDPATNTGTQDTQATHSLFARR